MAELGSNVIGEYLHSLHAEGSFPVPWPRYQFWLGLSLPAMSAGWHLCDFFFFFKVGVGWGVTASYFP